MRRVWSLVLVLLFLPMMAAAHLLQLDRTDPARSTIGELAFRGAFVLPPGRGNFGGLSALQPGPAPDQLLALSDLGRIFTLTLHWDGSGRLSSVTADQGATLLDEDGSPLKSRARRDAEAMVRLPGGGWLVAFERDHRIEQYADRAGLPFGQAKPFPAEPGWQNMPRNQGLEALTCLPDGRLLALAEAMDDGGSHPGWLWQDGHWRILSYKAAPGLHPADLTALPDGRVFVLERGFNLLYGFRARIVELGADEVRPGAALTGRPLAVLESPVLSENFEGLLAVPAPGGGARLFLLSDNNFNAAQQTILAVFDLSGASPAKLDR